MPVEERTFQIHLEGLIRLLAQNLYADPDIFLREMIQNAHDSIGRRSVLAAERGETELPPPQIRVVVDREAETIEISDNGCGLTREEIDDYLSTIGQSGNTDELRHRIQEADRSRTIDLIGQFGIGLLSAFIVAEHVTLVHRRDTLRAERILQNRLFANPKISVIWDHVPADILAGGTPEVVKGLRLKHARTGAMHDIQVDGVFIAIGHTPNTAIFAGQLTMDAEGYIQTTPGSTRTSVPGVFAAGDVQDKVFRQAVTAAGTGCMAALEAEKFLAEQAESPALAAN